MVVFGIQTKPSIGLPPPQNSIASFGVQVEPSIAATPPNGANVTFEWRMKLRLASKASFNDLS
jgi:hypothetical protein